MKRLKKMMRMNWNNHISCIYFVAFSLIILLIGWLVAAPVLAQDGAGQIYIVQSDDTLWKIAEKYLGDGNRYPEIIAATQAKRGQDPSFARIEDPGLIFSGSKLWIGPAGVLSPGEAVAESTPPQQLEETGNDLARPPVPAGMSSGPAGHIAFSFWNNSPERCTYEINVIDVAACLAGPETCQVNRRVFALNNASEPALSPDGSRLAFRGWGEISEKYDNDRLDHPYFNCPGPQAERRMGHTSLDGTEYQGLGQFWEDAHPDWSPDGQRLLFDTGRHGDGITRIMTVYADGTGEGDLRLAGQQPSWAPDNDRFVYRGCDLTGNRCGLWLARALPVQAWDLGLNLIGPVLEEPAAAQPDWSPVDDRIVYQSPVTGSWDLYLINADGNGKQQLTTEPGLEGLPAWSPNGQWIAYLSDAGGEWGIWIIRADGSEHHLLFPFDGGIFTPLAITPYFNRDWLDEQISWSL
jgi:hypothetical protein